IANFFNNLKIDEFRVRGAWGQAGQAPPPYVATQTYTAGRVILGDDESDVGSFLRTLAFGNPGLEPERGSEIEVGFDLSALDNRVGLELTYYNKTMDDVLITRPVPASTGWVSSRYVNLGKTKNTGFEV